VSSSAVPFPSTVAVRRDEIICLIKAARTGNDDLFLRRIEVWDQTQQRTLVFSPIIAAFRLHHRRRHRHRWQIELFFQSAEANLRIKGPSVGHQLPRLADSNLDASDRAAPAQLTCNCALALAGVFPISPALLRQQLFAYLDLFAWIDEPFRLRRCSTPLSTTGAFLVSPTWNSKMQPPPYNRH